jgi:hypothetical protein
MKANVTLQDVRKEFKAQSGSINYCLGCIYAAIEQGGHDAKALRVIMPKTKKQAYEHAAEIATFGKVGEIKTINKVVKGCKTEISYKIKPSVDMVLRYFVKQQ